MLSSITSTCTCSGTRIIFFSLLFSSAVVVDVDATYECSGLLDAQGARRLLPSVIQDALSTSTRPIPDIYVPSRNLTLPGDVAHIVKPPKPSSSSSDAYSYLTVFLPATLSSPSPFSCLLASIDVTASQTGTVNENGPVIGLMYEWLHDADANRAAQCAAKYDNSSASQAYSDCLASGTEDALRGGRREGIWQEIDPLDSIQGRLTLLLEYLTLNYPNEGWERYLIQQSTVTYATSTRLPDWSAVWLLGHSQGAGHAAYMAQAYALRGAGIFGGPQQLCASPQCWTARPWKTKAVRFLMHRDEQYYDFILRNLKNTPKDGDGPLAADFTEPYDISNQTDFRTDDSLPLNLPWVTAIPTFPQPSCGTIVGPHCSVAVDRNAPVISEADLSVNKTENPVIYAAWVWPQMAGRGDGLFLPTQRPTASMTTTPSPTPPTAHPITREPISGVAAGGEVCIVTMAVTAALWVVILS